MDSVKASWSDRMGGTLVDSLPLLGIVSHVAQLYVLKNPCQDTTSLHGRVTLVAQGKGAIRLWVGLALSICMLNLFTIPFYDIYCWVKDSSAAAETEASAPSASSDSTGGSGQIPSSAAAAPPPQDPALLAKIEQRDTDGYYNNILVKHYKDAITFGSSFPDAADRLEIRYSEIVAYCKRKGYPIPTKDELKEGVTPYGANQRTPTQVLAFMWKAGASARVSALTNFYDR